MTLATLASLPSPVVIVVQEVTSSVVEVVVLATQVDSIVVSLFTVAAPLLSDGVIATNAPTVLPPSSTTLMVSPSTVLVAVVSPSSSSHPRILLDHLYTFSDVDSLWGATYKPE